MITTLLATVALFQVPNTPANCWPEFRGPSGDGHANVTSVPLTWSETSNVKWKTPIHGKGWSTPVIWGNQVWLTTATADGKERSVLCLDATTGKVLLDKVLYVDPNPEPLGNDVNCYAAPTPLIEAGRVYVHFGSIGTACLDTKSFKTIWERQDIKVRHYRGPSSSIVGYGNTIILTLDGADKQFLIALDKKTGETKWRTDRTADWQDLTPDGKVTMEGDLRKAHSTPFITTVDGKPCMVTAGAKAMYAYDPATGKEIWKFGHKGYSASMRPVVGFGMAYLTTGYGGADLVAMKLGGTGAISEGQIAWRYRKQVPSKPSPLLVDDLLYLIQDSGVLTCLDARTGEEYYKERVGGQYSASPLYAAGRIYLFTDAGKSLVIKPGKKLEILAENTLTDGCMACVPAVGKALFIRTKSAMYRIEE